VANEKEIDLDEQYHIVDQLEKRYDFVYQVELNPTKNKTKQTKY
jgi:hypothetical protein